MKNVGKLLIVVMMFSWGLKSFAQPIFGIKAGLNMSTVLVKDDEDTYSDDFKMKPGFHVGPTAEFPINDMLSFETGLLLSTKGFKSSGEETFMGETISYEYKETLLYIDIPLTVKASFDIGGAKLFGAVGPYLGYGMSGTYKSEASVLGETETEDGDIEFGSDEEEDDYKPLDLGLTIGAGLGINSFEVGLSYALGMANVSPYSENGFKANHRVLALSFAYKFGKK